MLGFNLLTTLVTPHFDRLGDSNPQLLRELRGRLKRFPVITACSMSASSHDWLLGSAARASDGQGHESIHISQD